ncbi:hypothetical protein NDU88_006371 [Pleurodeles waltl]|uniref:Uncharacterized protein n=1 Tax=Pleurodeles waltl TaxID=8319 RepID=A0AAV7QIU8_PLEWA|nr:hypothetical protein NDU88_006371 [Pleurodeles waltl]
MEHSCLGAFTIQEWEDEMVSHLSLADPSAIGNPSLASTTCQPDIYFSLEDVRLLLEPRADIMLLYGGGEGERGEQAIRMSHRGTSARMPVVEQVRPPPPFVARRAGDLSIQRPRAIREPPEAAQLF